LYDNTHNIVFDWDVYFLSAPRIAGIRLLLRENIIYGKKKSYANQ